MNEYIKKRIIAKKILQPYMKECAETKQSGIYLFKRTDEQGITYFYCGQSVNVYSRIISHMNGYKQRIDLSIRSRGFKSDKKPFGWELSVITYCKKEELDELETKYIMECLQKGWQTYNTTYGSQGEGKTTTKEYKPPKGYRDGLEQGYKNARKDVKPLFDKYLDYNIKAEKQNNRFAENALEKFKNFLEE